MGKINHKYYILRNNIWYASLQKQAGSKRIFYSSHSYDWKPCLYLFNENKGQCPVLSASDQLVRESLGWLKILYVHCSDCSPWHGLTFMVITEAMGNLVILQSDLCWVFKDDVQRFVCQHVIKVTSHVERDKLQFFPFFCLSSLLLWEAPFTCIRICLVSG